MAEACADETESAVEPFKQDHDAAFQIGGETLPDSLSIFVVCISTIFIPLHSPTP
jgi:hypothetical protein